MYGIEDAIRCIKRLIKNGNIAESRHYTQQLRERDLIPTEVASAVSRLQILGATYQGNATYRLWLPYKNGKDLNIIVRILNAKHTDRDDLPIRSREENAMSRTKGIYTYHFEDDVIYVRPSKRVYASSQQMGSFIFDLNETGEPVGFEILNASKLFQIPREALRHLTKLHLKINVTNERVEIEIHAEARLRNGKRNANYVMDRARPAFLQPSELNLAAA